jgi:TonB-linked SusC/RagA family outer membrane protein
MKRILLISFVLMASLISEVMAQRTVSGQVTSAEDGDGLPGVSVRVQGTNTGVTTDFDGNYRLEVPEGANTLVFSFVGYQNEEVEIGNRSVIDVALQEDVQQLQEVVVTAFGLEANKRALGYTVQEVEGAQVAQAQETNLVNALNSKVAGVNIYSSAGTPGASASIRIRGNTSITGNNSPLFVVDGVPISNDEVGSGVGGVDQSNRAIDINPNDIKSMSVLKGPAATALYGIRAANGAIIITTKRGAAGAPTVTVSTSHEFSEVNRLPEKQNLYAQGRNNVYRGPATFEGFSWGPLVSELEYDGNEDYPWNPLGSLVPRGEGSGIPAETYDNLDNFFVTGYTTDNNVSVSGGSEKTTYYLSGGYLNQTGVVPNADFSRKSGKVTVNTNITDKLTAGISANYVNSGGTRMQRGSNLRGIMLGLLRNTPTFDLGNGYVGREAAGTPEAYMFPDGAQRSYRNGIYDNPYWVVNKNVTEDDVNRIIGYVNVGYEILPSLNVSYKLGIDQYSDRRLGHIDINRGFGLDFNWDDGSVQNDNIFSRDLNSDLIFTYDKIFGEDWTLNATVGHNYFASNWRRVQVTGNTLSQPDFYNLNNAASYNSFENINRRKLAGVYGDFKIGYREMVYLNLTGRNDWSSTLPEDDNSFFYPAVSLGFVFTEAFGMSDSDVLPFGKLRLSYGQVGNDAPLYSTRNYFTQAFAGGDGFTDGINFPFLGLNGFERSLTLGNNNLRAELTTTYEIGADLGFFNNRLNLDVTYYYSETKDQILPVDISPASGFTSRIQNAGLVSNEGIEAVLGIAAIQTPDFTWDVNVNFTHYETVVEELAPGLDNVFLAGFTSTSSRAIAGQPFGVLYGNAYRRDEAGNLIIGEEGFPLLEADPQIIGDPNPDYIMGIRNSFSYKGFQFGALLDIRQGGDIWNGTWGIMQYFGTSGESGELRGEATDGVIIEGVTLDGQPNTQQVDFYNPAEGFDASRWVRYGFGTISEDNIQDGSWFRVREVSLGYTLPESLLGARGIRGAEIRLTGRNLFLYAPNYKGIDPETNLTGTGNGFGLDYFNNPNTRGYAATLRLTF